MHNDSKTCRIKSQAPEVPLPGHMHWHLREPELRDDATLLAGCHQRLRRSTSQSTP
jgi:hypothetical protein